MSPITCPLFFSPLMCVMCWICRIYFCLAPAFLTPAALLAHPPWGSEAPPHHLTFQSIPTPHDLSSKCSLMCFSLGYYSHPGSHHFLPCCQLNCARSSCIHSSVCIYPTRSSQIHMAPGTGRLSFLCRPMFTPPSGRKEWCSYCPIVTLSTVNTD